MEQKTLDAIQAAFKQAVDAFNKSLVSALGEKSAVTFAPALVAVPKHRGRPAKAKSLTAVLVDSAKRRGRPPKSGDAVVKSVGTANSAPKRRGRPPKNK